MMTTNLRAGDVVEVRAFAEIRATLDADGTLEGMPFMPEMAQFCGKRFRVVARAHKTCDTVNKTGGVAVRSAVHLEALRCDGSGHGGCQAACLIFWKDAWVKRVKGETSAPIGSNECAVGSDLPAEWSRQRGTNVGDTPARYRCQATELPNFTTPLKWWDLRQYVEDFTSGNVGLGDLARGLRHSLFRMYLAHGIGYGLVVRFYNWYRRLIGGLPFPFVAGTQTKTPHAELGLQPGEWVRVKDLDSIIATLDSTNKNRGLSFEPSEMRVQCNNTFRVADRIRRIINENTGEMMTFTNPCITLEGVVCTGKTTAQRMFCPRAITPYWREIWLERASDGDSEPSSSRD
jgi:hypothetical protein